MCQSCVEVKNEDNFVNLHLHSAFSLLDGMSKVEDIVSKVKSMGQSHFAITEHGNVHSSVRAYKLAKEEGLKFIYGCEFYICEDRFEKNKDKKYFHITVLASNEQGRVNINKLTSLGFLEGFYFKPRIDFELLSEYGDGLIVLSGCMASEVQQALAGGKIGNGDIEITSNNIEEAKKIIYKYKKRFKANYYLEVQSHRDYRQQKLNRAIVDLAQDMDIEYVATADSHFVNEEDLDLHRIFIGINRNKDNYEDDETYQDTHIQTEKEAWNLLQSLTEEERTIAVLNTKKIANKTDVHMPLSAALIPKVEVPSQFNSQEAYLKHLCNQGWKFRGINKKEKTLMQKYKDRLFYEYEAISEMGFAGYYLLVYGYANSVQRRGIARGSGGGSLVAYLLNIVDIDPIEHGLYFERFIDVAQLEMLRDGVIQREELKIPDFDLDFGTHERDKVMTNIIEEHGKNKVAALCQFGYIWDKSAIKDIGRVLNIPFEITNKITKVLGEDTIEGAMLTNEQFRGYEKTYPKLFEYAKKIAGLPRSYGVHPCGKIISIDDVTHYTGISEKEGEYVLQIDMADAEALGLVKVDLLGLRTIDVIYDTLDLIGKDVDYIRDLVYSDENILSIFKEGVTDGIFQFESPGMKSTMKKMQPTGIDDLSAVNALYRPGSMKYIDSYIDRMHGIEQFEYLHSDLKTILGNTYGIIVFQEQLIEIGRLAKMRNPDLLRQATGKKDIKKLNKAEPELRGGLYARGWTEDQVDELWSIMLEFAKYSFNKAHSQAYAIVAFICAMLKKNHPLEFMASWLNSLKGKHEKFEVALAEADRMGIQISSFDYKNAKELCVVENGSIAYGISLIKHCNEKIASELRELGKRKYDHFIEMLVDIEENTSINSKQLDILIRLGFFSQVGEIDILLAIYDTFINGSNKYKKTYVEKTKSKRIEALVEEEKEIRISQSGYKWSANEIVMFYIEHMGYCNKTFVNANPKTVTVIDIDTKYSPKIIMYSLLTGKRREFKMSKKDYSNIDPKLKIEIGDLISLGSFAKKPKRFKNSEGEWEENKNEFDFWIQTYKKHIN